MKQSIPVGQSNDLKNKVKPCDPRLIEKRLVDAEAIINELKADYLVKLTEDLNQLAVFSDILNDAKSMELREETLSSLFQLSHNMKGQAATFGFPMITDVGNSLCILLSDEVIRDDRFMALTQSHIQTMLALYKTKDDIAEQKKASSALEALISVRKSLIKK